MLDLNLTTGAPRIPLSKSSLFQLLKTIFPSIKTSILTVNLKSIKKSYFIPTPEYIDPPGSKSYRGAKDLFVKKFTFSTFKDNFPKYKNLNF